MSTLTLTKLKELLCYDSISGKFFWKERIGDKRFNSNFAGKEAGSKNKDGYIQIKIGKHLYLAHRLAWFYWYRCWPSFVIDHKDQCKGNNAIDNLRDVSMRENNLNHSRTPGKSGIIGVRKNGKKWQSYASINGKIITFGTFNTKKDASLKRDAEMKNPLLYQNKTSSREQKNLVTHAELIDLLIYEKDTGCFYWRKNNTRAGEKSTRSYMSVSVKKRRYRLNVLAWFYMTGNWPTGIIDHKDGNKQNNRFDNLLDTNFSNNAFNRSLKELSGISQYKTGKWRARIRIDGVKTHLGTFNTKEEARAAYDKAFEKITGRAPRFILPT